jgi:uncharacterized membrane protein (DUF2068 family)
MERPTGVTILAILAIIGGLLGLFGSLAIFALGGAATVIGAAGAGAHAVVGGGLLMGLAVFLLILSVLQLAFGIGAWTLQPWAWTLGVIAQGLSLLGSVAQILNGHGIGSQLFSILIAGLILYYLFTPTVKEAFGKA